MDFNIFYILFILLFILDDVDSQFFRRRTRPRKARKRADIPKCTGPCLPYRTCKKLVKQGMHTPLCSDYYTHKTFQKIFEKLKLRGEGTLRPVDASHMLSENTPKSSTQTKQNAGDVSLSAPQANVNTGRRTNMNIGRRANVNTGRQARTNIGRQIRRGMTARNPLAGRRNSIRRVAQNFQNLLRRGMPPRHIAPRLDVRHTAPQPPPPTKTPFQDMPVTHRQVQPRTPRPITQRPTTPRPTTQRPTTPRPTTQRPTTPRPTTQRPTTPRPTTPNPDALQEKAIRSVIGGFHSLLLQRPKNRHQDFTDVPLEPGATQKPTTTTSGWEMSAEMQDIVALESINMSMFTGELNPNSTEARCFPCAIHDDCNVPMGLYCFHSIHCNKQVCQELHKRPVPQESA